MDDYYLTINKPSLAEIKIKGSRFIGRTVLVNSVDEALEELNLIRKKEFAATHNCYAYLVGINDKNTAYKYSDDGEPGGTAGRPIYDVIAGSKLTNILLVVTRYFGGTKLGTGGLVHAYSETAKLVLGKSGIKENFITDRFKIEIAFPQYDKLIQTIHKHNATVITSDFSDHVSVVLEIRRSMSDFLTKEITELSKGKAKIEKLP
ncbi:MAG: YigZ family protein [FCB group bacterium]|nr:YigZ family protein [FCB group bacterium]